MPSTLAASRSSCSRTRPRSPSGTSAGSLMDPPSPRDAQSRTTLAPASARRASVPPHASDSSSGCANTASTVRPVRSSVSSVMPATMHLHDALVHGHVLVNHALHAEACRRPGADQAAIETEYARQLVDHLLEITEHEPG